jgi:hypothetical protein
MSDNDQEKRRMFGGEQISFTGAAVAFNWAASKFDDLGGKWAVLLVSVLTVHLIMSRWIAAAGLVPKELAKPSHGSIDSGIETYLSEFGKRASWTLWELWTGLKAIPYVVAEASGSLFLLLGVGLSCFLAIASIAGKKAIGTEATPYELVRGLSTNSFVPANGHSK